MTGLTAEVARVALDLARLAPSAHNTQPWRVALEGERLVVSVDRARSLAWSDPLERDLHLGMGGFVEATILALRSLGLDARLVDAPSGSFAAIEARGACDRDARQVSLLRRRQTSRLAYSPREIDAHAIDALVASAQREGLALHLAGRDTPERKKLDGWFYSATREAWLDGRSVRELRKWVRLDPEGVRAPLDGLSTHCLGLGAADALGLMAALCEAPWRVANAVFLGPSLAEGLAASELRDVAASPFLGLLVAERPDVSRGSALLHTWLAATELGLALHPVSVLLDRRGWEVARHLGVPMPSLVFACRLGRSAPPPRAGRLSVERFAKL